MNSTMKMAVMVPSLAGGGAERVAAHLTISLSKLFSTYVIVEKGEIGYEYAGELINLRLDSILDRNFVMRIRNTLMAILKLKAVKKRYKLHLVISFLELANIPNLLSGGSKAIISVREHRLASNNDLQRKITNALISYLYRRADLIISASEGIKYSLSRDLNLPVEKIRVIYNPLIVNKIEELSREPVESEFKKIFSGYVIATSGRLTHQKGHWHLLRAFKQVKMKIPDAKLLILGEGDYRNLLEETARRLGVRQDVVFAGFVTNPFKLISRADIFVLPSLWEGFPNVLAEAMACGVPVISSDCDTGPREILAPDSPFNYRTREIEFTKFGILCPVPDGQLKQADDPISIEESLFAKAITDLLLNESLRFEYSSSGRVRAADFSFKNILPFWLKAIKDIS